MDKPFQEVRILIPASLLTIIDRAVDRNKTDRAEFIRDSIFEKIERSKDDSAQSNLE